MSSLRVRRIPWDVALLWWLTACAQVPSGMIFIPAGTFTMGSDQTDPEQQALEYGIIKPWFADEHPAHPVTLSAYYLDRYEATNAEYQVFVTATRRAAPPEWTNGRYPIGRARYPVVSVTWTDADAYCRWAGKRLPTEAEWERAARGTEGRAYPWGDTFELARANVGGAHGGTTVVGSYPSGKSPEGAYDLIGNVWEWVSDWYGPYAQHPDPSATDTKGKPVRVLRGASWSGIGHFSPDAQLAILAHNARGSFRLYADPDGRLNDVGFRCAKDF